MKAAPQNPAAVVPGSTYRLQLHGGFPFAAAAAVAAYLEALGLTHVYCSPYLQAAPGSNHGYDVTDHASVNRELGGAPAHADFSRTLREHGLGQVLDIVPNHMSIASRENSWWWDVLRHGRRSRFADHFDVDWDSPEAKLRDKVLVPILGDHYGRVLRSDDLRIEADSDGLVVRYFEHALPIDPQTAPGEISAAEIERLNTDREALHMLLERQHFRLASWRTAGRELDYRRFFDVNSLAGLRMEDERVFLETHAFILRWLDAGVLDGVRIDHPDGLRDPGEYCRRIREAAPWSWIVVEKILAAGEALPPDWPVAGTTGYEFLNLLNQLYVDSCAEGELSRFYQDFAGVVDDFREIAHERKKLVLQDVLASDLRRLTDWFVRVCEANRDYRDFTRHDLWHVLSEYIACLPVYRTYIRPGEAVSSTDRAHVESAIGEAIGRRPDLDPELFDFLA
ncbi:MAG: malto-oligosyltrehalose synthase, partial [Candidatus Dormibacteraeota bacterium]|nr:malto-oligosyltrehalose synthase [Candidatus Dormibacteraeota bacterium]